MTDSIATSHRLAPPRSGYRYYALALMTLVYTVNLVDRGLIMILLQPIKEDLNLSDTQLGFVTGIAFGLFYAVMGIPIARLADRGNRATITSLAIGFWGLSVMTCLFIANFSQLVLARVAAAVGEAGCKPPTYSLLGDYFPAPRERTRAMSVYWTAAPLAGLISFILGGWLNEQVGWRLTFFLMGIPGLLLAALVRLSLRDPRARNLKTATKPAVNVPLHSVFRVIAHRGASRHLTSALVLLYTMSLGLGPWYAAFMIRSHGMSTAELGLWLGLIFGVAGVGGILLGATIADRWFAGREGAQLRASAALFAMLVPIYVAFLLLPTKGEALVALTAVIIVLNLSQGPVFALVQRLAPVEMRATSLAVILLVANVVGMGVGPQIVGVLSDGLAPVTGENSLRYAMLAVSLLALWTAAHLGSAARTIHRDLEAIENAERG